MLAKYPDLTNDLPPLADALSAREDISYTQWEAWLALYHRKLLLAAEAMPAAPRHAEFAPTEVSRRAQIMHLARLAAVRRYPGCKFTDAAELASHILSTAILDLLAKDYAAEAAQGRAIAEGFIREMAGKVAADRALDLDGMKQAIRNALDIYEREIAGGPTGGNLDAIVAEALARAKAFAAAGKSTLAQATLRCAAERRRADEVDRRAQYEQEMTALYGQLRDIALATYDAEAAAHAIRDLGEALHRGDRAALFDFLDREGDLLLEHGRDKGSNVHLRALIPLWRDMADLAENAERKGHAQNNLGAALATLGGRESGTARLEKAVAAYEAALEERTRERAPLAWAMTQNNLGVALTTVGERESGTAQLEEAAAAYRLALE